MMGAPCVGKNESSLDGVHLSGFSINVVTMKIGLLQF